MAELDDDLAILAVFSKGGASKSKVAAATAAKSVFFMNVLPDISDVRSPQRSGDA
ncbi:hypothetical protein V6L77_08910 [Pannonibacter sp. Pt2-lr]